MVSHIHYHFLLYGKKMRLAELTRDQQLKSHLIFIDILHFVFVLFSFMLFFADLEKKFQSFQNLHGANDF